MSEPGASKRISPSLYSIGHGDRRFDKFLALLRAHRIVHLADVRSYPRSKRNPHFDREILRASLKTTGISYTWLPELGGFRKNGLGKSSPHVALKTVGFRNYAEHMETESFGVAANELIRLASLAPTCLMCAETV
ncbi:MAG: DUF488 domain-containing protein, partial [Deltaproteobacteria bacterium]